MCAKVMKKSVIANFYQFVFAICQKSRDCKQFATPHSLYFMVSSLFFNAV